MKGKVRNITLVVFTIFIQVTAIAQQNKLEDIFRGKDTLAVIDSILADFDFYLDSLSKPKSFFAITAGVGSGLFSSENKNSVEFITERKLIVSPSLAYFHKSGLGLAATAYLVQQQGGLGYYQSALSPSYDLIRKNVSTGISYTRFLQKDSLQFYSTPIQNEVFAYFSYKKWWLRPTIGVGYGWGSSESFERQKFKLIRKRLAASRNLFVRERTTESIDDLSVLVSIRKDFNWYSIFSENDNISLTPIVVLNCGTQRYGFNTSYSYRLPSSIRTNSLPSNNSISEQNSFAAQSVAMIFRGSYMKGRVLLQPQLLLDYYLPEAEKPLSTAFAVMAGINF